MLNLESLGPVAPLVDQLSKLEIFTWKALCTPSKTVWSGLRKKYVRDNLHMLTRMSKQQLRVTL